jgi:hypothetical protein
MDEFTALMVKTFKKWQEMAIQRRIPHIRAVTAARLLCKTHLQELAFDDRWDRIFMMLKDMPRDSWPEVKVHWQDWEDGSKWLYFCKADPTRNCEKCFQKEECDVK